MAEHALLTQGVVAVGDAPAVQKALNTSQAAASTPTKLLQGEVANTHTGGEATTHTQAPAVESVQVKVVK